MEYLVWCYAWLANIYNMLFNCHRVQDKISLIREQMTTLKSVSGASYLILAV